MSIQATCKCERAKASESAAGRKRRRRSCGASFLIPRGDDFPHAPAYLSDGQYDVLAPEPGPTDDTLAAIAAVVRTEDDDLMAPLPARAEPPGTSPPAAGPANATPELWFCGFLAVALGHAVLAAGHLGPRHRERVGDDQVDLPVDQLVKSRFFRLAGEVAFLLIGLASACHDWGETKDGLQRMLACLAARAGQRPDHRPPDRGALLQLGLGWRVLHLGRGENGPGPARRCASRRDSMWQFLAS